MNASKMIQEARVRHGFSQHYVADLLGLQVRQYQRFEYGEVNIGSCRAWKIMRLCRVLELNPFELIPEEDETVIIRIRAVAEKPVDSTITIRTDRTANQKCATVVTANTGGNPYYTNGRNRS